MGSERQYPDAPELDGVPPDLVAFVEREADRDADRVIELVRRAGIPPGPMDRRVLLGLGAYVRLREWERAGWNVHRDAGLPSAADALQELIAALEAATSHPGRLTAFVSVCQRVYAVLWEAFAWAGPPELGAEVLVGTGEDDAMLEAVARFLLAAGSKSEREEAA